MGIETGVEDRQWYVVHTKAKQEERASRNLVAWGVETLHAKLKTRAPAYLTQPLFPRYIFAKFNAREQLSKILLTRGVHNVVCFGDRPASVSEEIIDLIRARIDQNGFVKVSNDLKSGPLRNLTEIFEREIKGSERSMILLAAIGDQRPSCG